MQMGVRGSDLEMTAAIDGDHSVPAQPKMSAESAEVHCILRLVARALGTSFVNCWTFTKRVSSRRINGFPRTRKDREHKNIIIVVTGLQHWSAHRLSFKASAPASGRGHLLADRCHADCASPRGRQRCRCVRSSCFPSCVGPGGSQLLQASCQCGVAHGKRRQGRIVFPGRLLVICWDLSPDL